MSTGTKHFSNAVIKSDGLRHWVEVEGVTLTHVRAVNIKYELGEIVSAEIIISNPVVDNRAERK